MRTYPHLASLSSGSTVVRKIDRTAAGGRTHPAISTVRGAVLNLRLRPFIIDLRGFLTVCYYVFLFIIPVRGLSCSRLIISNAIDDNSINRVIIITTNAGEQKWGRVGGWGERSVIITIRY